MKKLFFPTLFIAIFTLTSCDPSHNINFKNNGTHIVKVKLKIDPNTEEFGLTENMKGDSIVFNLKPGSTETAEGNLLFGIDTWHDTNINEISKAIKSIEIENVNYKILYKSEYSIRKVLLQNRKGYWMRTDIDFNINDDLVN